MMTRQHLAHATTTLLLAATTLAACDSDDSPPRLDRAAIAELEALADGAVAAGIPGVSLVVRAGDQTVAIARGVADLATRAPVTPASRFRVASVTKSVVAAVTLQLVDEGKLRLGDTIETWLPGMVPANNEATIEQLLRLESGLFNFAEDPRHMAPYLAGDLGHVWSPEQLVALATDHPPLFAPGTRWMYSNTNYTLLALVIQKVTGAPLAEVVRQRITAPLAMTSTALPTDSHLDEPYARGYLVGNGEPLDVTGMSASATFGNGHMVSTPADVATFYRALVAGRVVSPRLLPAMLSRNPGVPGVNYGMGMFLFDDFVPCASVVGHDGATAGYDGVAYSTRDGRRQFVVWTNSVTFDSKVGDERAQAAFLRLIEAAACR